MFPKQLGGFTMSNKVQKMDSVSMFAAMGLVMQFVAFPILPVFPFLKIDFSDIPVLLSMFLYGPMAGVATAFLRSVLHTITTGLSPQNLVGDVASFLATTVFTLPIYYIFRRGTSPPPARCACTRRRPARSRTARGSA